MAAKAKSKSKTPSKDVDWFQALDEELERKSEELKDNVDTLKTVKREINAELIKDLWRIWIRFNKIDVLFSMEPVHSDFAIFTQFPENWSARSEFKYENVDRIRLADTTQAQNRIGDSLLIQYVHKDDAPHLQMVFEFCEGEHYYKYAGWKRTYVQYILYESPVDDIDMDSLHEILGTVVMEWYESHLRKDRNVILDFIRDGFQKGSTYSQ